MVFVTAFHHDYIFKIEKDQFFKNALRNKETLKPRLNRALRDEFLPQLLKKGTIVERFKKAKDNKNEEAKDGSAN